MNYDILSTIYTISDRDLLLSEVELLKSSLYKTDVKIEDLMASQIRLSTSNYLAPILNAEPDRKEENLSQLKDKIMECEVVKITLAFSPSLSGISKIHDVLKPTVGGPFVFETFYEPTIVGGIMIVIRGKYIDLSLKSRFQEYFLTKKTLSDF